MPALRETGRVLLIAGFCISLSNVAFADPACQGAALSAWETAKLTPKFPGEAACFKPKGMVEVALGEAPCTATSARFYADADEAKADGRPTAALSKLSDAACPILFVARGVAAPVRPAPQPCQEATSQAKELENILDAKTAADALDAATPSALNGVVKSGAPIAIGTGIADVAAETLQILGQIVVDRASQAGYRLITEKIQDGLECLDTHGNPDPTTTFPATCDVVASTRIQDLAMSRDALLRALASDLIHAGLAKLPTASRAEAPGDAAAPKQATSTWTLTQTSAFAYINPTYALNNLTSAVEVTTTALPLLAVTQASLLPALLGAVSDPTKKRAGVAAQTIASELEALARDQRTNRDPRLEPLLLAGAGLVSCQARVAAGQLANLADCDISKEVDRFPGRPAAKAVGRAVARSLQVALTATSDRKPDPDKRILGALAATFDATCFYVDSQASFGCPALIDVAPSDKAKVVLPLALARGVLEAALERDSNRLVATAVRGLDWVVLPAANKQSTTSKAQQRALRLLAGVVDYANTYPLGGATPEAGASQEGLHDQRTKILESLTADMTARSGREGDWIGSLGGSFALTGGARFGSGKPVFNGPLSLSLGFALQNVPTQSVPVGWHFEVGVFDLAQYLTFQSKPDADTPSARTIVVREPNVRDAVAPSVKIGFQWGRDVPFFLAAVAGYAPFYEFVQDDGDLSRPGAWTVGAALGGYVPLLDLN